MTEAKQYNRLLSRAWRAQQLRTQPPGTEIDEARSSGRTTAVVLMTLAKAIAKPGEWITLADHPDGVQSQVGQDRIANEVMSFAARLELKFFEKRTGRFGVRSAMLTQVRCCMFTDNPWEIV